MIRLTIAILMLMGGILLIWTGASTRIPEVPKVPWIWVEEEQAERIEREALRRGQYATSLLAMGAVLIAGSVLIWPRSVSKSHQDDASARDVTGPDEMALLADLEKRMRRTGKGRTRRHITQTRHTNLQRRRRK